MKYIRTELRFPPEIRHPIHQLVDDSDAIARDVLVQGTVMGEGMDTFLFYVEGDIDVYTDALRSVDRIREYEITKIDEEGYYVFLTQDSAEVDEATFETLQRTGLVVVPPIDFRPDGVAHLTLIGTSETLRAGLEGIPEAVEATILRIGEYDWRQGLFSPELTNRQFEALTAAVECGYYETPREGSINNIADQLDTSSSTASEHLRKAEAAVMSAFIGLRDV